MVFRCQVLDFLKALAEKVKKNMVVSICLVIGSFVVAVCHVGASLTLMYGPWKLDAWNYVPA